MSERSINEGLLYNEESQFYTPSSPCLDSTVAKHSPRIRAKRPMPVDTTHTNTPSIKKAESPVQNPEEESYLSTIMSSFSFALSDVLDPTSSSPEEEPSSPSPSSTHEHPNCVPDLALDQSPKTPTSSELVVPTSKKVRCTGCGVKVSAVEAKTHICNFAQLFTRCSHCGEKVPLLEASIHWCEGAVHGKSLEPPSPGSPLNIAGIAVTAASSSAGAAFKSMGTAMESAAEYTAYSTNVGNVAAASAVGVVNSITQPSPWQMRLGYDLAAAPSMNPGHEVEFESELLKGSVFVALKRDSNLDPATHKSFFEGKGRTVQVQWSVTLKRKLKGPLFIGFESNPSRLTGNLPRGTMQSGLISALSMFHGKKDLHLNLPQHQKPINLDNDWGLGVVGNKALVSFFETPPDQTPPPLNRPLESKLNCISFENMEVGYTYSFCWYTQYVEFTDMSLVNVPMLGRVILPFNAVRCVLYEHCPSPKRDKLTRAPSLAELKNPIGAVRMINKKAKARQGVDKLSAQVGDFLQGRMVVILELGVASDGTDRARVRGPGVCKSIVPSSPTLNGQEAEEVKDQRVRRKSKAVAELDAWVSVSLLDNPARDAKAMGSTEDRTYAFSCVFATA